MKVKQIFSFILAVTIMMSCIVTNTFSVAAEGNDYGVLKEGENGSLFLYFGQNSIINSGGGKFKDGTVNSVSLQLTESLKTDNSGNAQLKLPSINLNGKNFDKLDLWVGNRNDVTVSIKAGDIEIASFSDIKKTTGGSSDWDPILFTTNIITKEASGDVIIDIKNADGKSAYCGNYAYIRIYKDGIDDTPVGPNDEGKLPYLDESLSFEERAADLVSRMTLAEKVSQIGHKSAKIERLGVSDYNYWGEALHGVARQGKATTFPTALSMSNTWNRELVKSMADITSTEARIKNNKYNLSYWSPTINMARDPRWGRNEESYGEDPYLAGQIAVSFVKGLQGNDKRYLKTIATLKHFAANNNEANRRSGSSVMNEFNFRNYYTKVFQNVTEEVMPASVMSSYNATTIYRNGSLDNTPNSVPSLANSYLLQNLLRRNWGFSGYVTSDCGAGEDLISVEQYKNAVLGDAKQPNEAYIAEAFKSGLDVECNLGGGNKSQLYGVASVENGYLPEGELDRVVYELFLQRFKTGEFDKLALPYRDTEDAKKSDEGIETDDSVAVAEKVAEETFVLLKNEDSILPLKDFNVEGKKIAVVGNKANLMLLGDYTGTPTKTVTPIQGIKAAFPNATVEHLGVIDDDTKLFNIKSIKFILKNGSERVIPLKDAEVTNATKTSENIITDITPKSSIIIKNIDFNNVAKVQVEMATGELNGGSIAINYGIGGDQFALVNSKPTADINTYEICETTLGEAAVDYSDKKDMQITVSAKDKEFTVEAYKSKLDAADIIIAYAGTVPKQDGLGAVDSSESHDRSNIDLPVSQKHVLDICNYEDSNTHPYADKTIVVMSTVGQINVEPFMNNCKAIIWTSYNGQTQGTALGKVLTGEVNPSGRLTTTWYKNEDVSKMELYNNSKQTIGNIEGKYTDYNIQPDTNTNNPGHTYQYYNGKPIYPFGYGLSYTNFEYSNPKVDNSTVDANGKLKFTVNVKNNGTENGKEVVQLYIKHPEITDTTYFDENIMPKKQLKGFKKVEIASGSSIDVDIELNVRDLYLFSEKEQIDVVPTGEYTAYIASNAADETNAITFTVSGTLESKIKTVKAIPDGIVVKGRIASDGTELEPTNEIDPRLSVVMSDEQITTTSSITYTVSNPDIAKVENGKVVSGVKEGTAIITATVDMGNQGKASTSFPIVNRLSIKATDNDKSEAKAKLTEVYKELESRKTAYKDDTWANVEQIYNSGIKAIDDTITKDDMAACLEEKINELKSVVMDNLTVAYELYSVNPKHIEDNIIDYRDGGIPLYSGSVGTITNVNPYDNIQIKASDSGSDIDNSKIMWQIEKLGTTNRKIADIDSTGKLTVYGNGFIKIIAADIENLKCGMLTVYVNMQIEGEYADDDGGANLNDSQSGASGSHNVGDSSDSWIEYKDVKISELDNISIRYAGKDSKTVNISLDKNNNAENLIASAALDATGGWSTWAEGTLVLKDEALKNAVLDENGCATIYVQTNGLNLDYFKLSYLKTNDDEPYIVKKVNNKKDGKLNVDLKYRGSDKSKAAAIMFSCVKSTDGTFKSLVTKAVNGTGEYEIQAGASDNEKVQIYIWNSLDKMKPLIQTYETIYNTPFDSEIEIHSLNDSAYEKLTGGADNTEYADKVNGLGGYGGWKLVDSEASYTYADVNENEYPYNFTKAWQAGQGSKTKRSLFFTPKKVPCKVTAVFFGSASARSMKIENEDGTIKKETPGMGSVAEVSAEITKKEPIYVFGGNSDKQLYAIIVEYYGGPQQEEVQPPKDDNSSENTESEDIPIQYAKWGNSDVVLTKNSSTGKTKVWSIIGDNLKVSLDTDYFAESDVDYKNIDLKINCLAEYKDRLYAGCDDGLVVVFTECMKCYKLKKICPIDIKSMSISGETMYVSDGTRDIELNMTDIGGDSIEAEEANVLAANGGIFVDVRSAEEFAEESYSNSVNIPVDNIEERLSSYSKDTTFIFYCESGSRANQAIKKAKDMGFTNVYNLGSIRKLI